MTLNEEQLEWIVAEVMRRLNGYTTVEAPPTHELQITERLVTTQSLDGCLTNVNQLIVNANAVITPAAKDLLRDRGVRLVRGG